MKFQSSLNCRTGIYKIYNIVSGTAYIGQTSIDFKGRWKSHVVGLEKQNHHNPYLQRAWNKYGPDVFIATVEMYIECTNDDAFLEKLDSEELRILKLYPKHYNLMEAGEDRMVFSEESKKRASISARNRNITKEEHEVWERNRLAAVNSVESRAKRTEAHKKLWKDPKYREQFIAAYNSPEVKEKKSIKIKASFTEERRQKYTDMNLERWSNPEFKEKVRKKITISRNAPENKEKYSKGLSKGWEKRKADPEYATKDKERIRKILETRTRNKLEKLNQS